MKRELTKGDVYVVVDTPKKAKKLKKVLDVFKEPMFTIPSNKRRSHNGSEYGWAYGFSDGQWQGFNTKSSIHNGKKFKKVSIKELRNILAKEHLKEGDVFVGKNGGYKFIGVYKGFTERGLIEVSNWHNLNKDSFLDNINNTGGCFENFKRYATPEEIALLEPQNGLCSLCKSKLGIK